VLTDCDKLSTRAGVSKNVSIGEVNRDSDAVIVISHIV